jgi:hypothetical protein
MYSIFDMFFFYGSPFLIAILFWAALHNRFNFLTFINCYLITMGILILISTIQYWILHHA